MPSLSLIFKVAKLAKAHGPKLLHGSDVDLLTKDLGDALRRQQKTISDPDLGAIETAAEVAPIVAEVKILTFAVAKKLDIDTKGKSSIDVFEEVIKKTEDRKSNAADGLKETLDWTRTFFSQPKIQDILSADMTEIELPKNMTDIGGLTKVLTSTAVRTTQEVGRMHEFLKTAKEPIVEPPKATKPRTPKRKKSDPKP